MKNINMGNYLCGKQKGVQIHPPHNLRTLLSEIRAHDEISKCQWMSTFQNHLKSIRRTDLIAALDFVICSQIINNLSSNNQQNQAIIMNPHERRRMRRDLLVQIGQKHFSEKAEQRVALSNQDLHKELCLVLTQLDDKREEEALALVQHARRDHKVWKSLDAAYNRFLATKPTTPLSAVLLSIL